MKFFLALLALVISANSFGQLPGFESDKIRFRQKLDTTMEGVSRMRIENYELENGSPKFTKFWAIEEYVYDKGQIDSLHFIDSKTDSIYMSYFFDKSGRIKGQRRVGKDDWYPIITYEYNEQDLTTSENSLNPDLTPNIKTVIQYNNDLLPILKEEFKSDSVLRRYWIFEYDTCKNLIQKLYVNTPDGPGISAFGGSKKLWPNDTTIYERTYGLDCKLKTVKEISNSNLRNMTEYYSLGDTAISRTTEYIFNGEERRISYVKMLDSLKIEGIIFLGGTEHDHFESTYISDQLVNYIFKKNDKIQSESIYRTEFVNDKRGNWTVKRLFLNDTLSMITKRIITYSEIAH